LDNQCSDPRRIRSINQYYACNIFLERYGLEMPVYKKSLKTPKILPSSANDRNYISCQFIKKEVKRW
jgi:hypothetical protein